MLVDSPEDLGAAIRSRRRALRLTQADLAARAEVSRQWLVEIESGHPRAEIGRLLGVLEVLRLELGTVAQPHDDRRALDRMLPVPSLARAVRKEIVGGDTHFALRLIGRSIDELGHLDEADLPTFLSPPPSTGDQRWDTLISAAFRRECRRRGIDAPAWTVATPLPTWWFPVADRLLVARTMQRTPIDFSILGIWLDARALEVA
jgi:HTH-type transcriptional regulator/antitoxin HipB